MNGIVNLSVYYWYRHGQSLTPQDCRKARRSDGAQEDRDKMGERLLWAVKNGDLEAAKEVVEKVCFGRKPRVYDR